MIVSLYTAIRDELKLKLPWIKFVDLQKGQFDKPGDNHPLPLPTVLVGFNPIRWENTKGIKTGDLVVCIYLYLDNSSESFDGAEQERESLEMFTRVDDIFQTLEDKAGDTFQKMILTGDSIYKVSQRWICFKSEFTCRIAKQKNNNLTVVLNTKPVVN